MAKLLRSLTLGHRANLGEDASRVDFAEGDELEVLEAWSDNVLARDTEGRLFTIPRDALELRDDEAPDPA